VLKAQEPQGFTVSHYDAPFLFANI